MRRRCRDIPNIDCKATSESNLTWLFVEVENPAKATLFNYRG